MHATCSSLIPLGIECGSYHHCILTGLGGSLDTRTNGGKQDPPTLISPPPPPPTHTHTHTHRNMCVPTSTTMVVLTMRSCARLWLCPSREGTLWRLATRMTLTGGRYIRRDTHCTGHTLGNVILSWIEIWITSRSHCEYCNALIDWVETHKCFPHSEGIKAEQWTGRLTYLA